MEQQGQVTGDRSQVTAETPTKTSLLALDEPRVIAIRDGKFTYAFTLARITQEDWIRHFEGYWLTTREVKGARDRTADIQTACVQLVTGKLQHIEGYANDSQKAIPRHALEIANILLWVGKSAEENDSPIDPERVEVRLDAVWSRTKPGAEVTAYRGLKHWFQLPTAEQQKRLFRATSTSKVVGGSRNPTTIYGGKHRVLLELYDQLILAVDGYTVGGKPLTEDRAAIIREMDALHKIQAVQQVFNSDSEPAEEDARERAAA